jgi:predicted ArsR family transcriptional regulator
MKPTRLDERFFDSTRGRIVNLLRAATRTVNELAEELRLTDNAVRAHLLSLERDGLVRQSGLQRGHRKPHFAYELTPEAESLFPKAYDALVNQLISVLKVRLTHRELEDVLREVGRSIAGNRISDQQDGDLANRAHEAVKALEALGGSAVLESENDKLVIRSRSCPLVAAVSQHPEICELAAALVAEIVGASVQERCDRHETPKCCFEITETS